MKNAVAGAKKLSVLLKKLGHVHPPTFPAPTDPIAVLVMSFLLWESTTDRAQAAYERLMSEVVDFNDLRVCMPHETLEIVGPRYPRALDRCQRLRAVLRNIYLREHAVSLEKPATSGKREIRKYIESLEGIVPYVAARTLLLAFDQHGIPVDDQLRILLIDAEVTDVSVEVPELSAWLATQVRVGEAAATHFALQKWVDKAADRERRSSRKKMAAKR